MTELILPEPNPLTLMFFAFVFAISVPISFMGLLNIKTTKRRKATVTTVLITALVLVSAAIFCGVKAEQVGNETTAAIQEWANVNYGLELSEKDTVALFTSHEIITVVDDEPTQIAFRKFEGSWLLFVDGKPLSTISE